VTHAAHVRSLDSCSYSIFRVLSYKVLNTTKCFKTGWSIMVLFLISSSPINFVDIVKWIKIYRYSSWYAVTSYNQLVA